MASCVYLLLRRPSLVDELRERHNTMPTTTAALGRTATAGAMMGAMLKGEEKLTIQVKGDGPVGQIVVDANADGEVRGYVDISASPAGKQCAWQAGCSRRSWPHGLHPYY